MERWLGKQRRLWRREYGNQNALARDQLDRLYGMKYLIRPDHGFYSSRHGRIIHRQRRSPEDAATFGALAKNLSMEQLIATPNELRSKGFRALADTLGWANAVRFLRQYDPGSGNYTGATVTSSR
jgi:hypothetical protein